MATYILHKAKENNIPVPPIPNTWDLFRRSPSRCAARWIYRRRSKVSAPNQHDNPITVVCVSDTHNRKPAIPDGDILLHAGDMTAHGTFEELQEQISWLEQQPHKHKVAISGNHDHILDPEYVKNYPRQFPANSQSRHDLQWQSIVYMQDERREFGFGGGRKLKIYGSPITPIHSIGAFQRLRSEDNWSGVIPDDTDIVLTHGPPLGHLDGGSCGSSFLLKELWRVKPRLVVFGHIHPGHGVEHVSWDAFQYLYDKIILGENGIFSVIVLFLMLLVEKALELLVPKSYRNTPTGVTTFVNAAVVVGFRNKLIHDATSVDI